jgi:hypothetical protein
MLRGFIGGIADTFLFVVRNHLSMKYLFILTIFLACKSGPRKVFVARTDTDSTAQAPIKRDTISIDIHDPYETGKDTIRLNKVIETISKFPEVEAIKKQIDKNSKSTHGVSFMVHDEFNSDTSYYLIEVGDNSHDDKYVNVYDFLLEKQTGQIKAYDHLSGAIMSLQEWRKSRK